MAIGYSPRHQDSIKTNGLSEKQAYVIAVEAVNKLKWNVGKMGKNGFLAYTKASMSSWSEEIQIRFEGNEVVVKSICTGSQMIDWGKNKKNTKKFIETFNSIKDEIDAIQALKRFSELEKEIDQNEEDVTGSAALEHKEKISGVLSIFKPTKGFFITPILMNINIAIFIIMVISGVHFMMPENNSLVRWGANFRPETLNGEWWRLLTSTFLHIGVIHLLMNMYALLYIGLLLEPYLGKIRFLSAYLITGIFASTTSLYYNDLTISAGASGAIFGMYGVFLAMLTTNFIEKSARQSLLVSILLFVGYNVLNGFNETGIDNAAHIGGLISGIVIGYAFYPSLTKPETSKLKFGTIGILGLLMIASSYYVLTTTKGSDIKKYSEEMQKFIILEEKALSLFKMPESSTNEDYLEQIQKTGIPNWQASLELIEKVDDYDLSEELHRRNAKLKEYCKLRIKTYELLYKAISENTDEYESDIVSYTQQTDLIIAELSE